jgi:hypothetical protein
MIKNRFKSLLMKAQAAHKKEPLSERRLIKRLLGPSSEGQIEHFEGEEESSKRQTSLSVEGRAEMREEDDSGASLARLPLPDNE